MNPSIGMDTAFAVPLYVFPNTLVLLAFTVAYLRTRRLRQALTVWFVIVSWWMLAAYLCFPFGLRLHPVLVTFVFSNPVVAYAFVSALLAVFIFDAMVSRMPTNRKKLAVLSVAIAIAIFAAFIAAEMYFSTTGLVSNLLIGGTDV